MEQVKIKKIRYAWHNPYKVTLGAEYSRFLEGLKQKKIFGNICPKCGELYVPARPFCDDCLEKPIEWIETDGMATLQSFTVTHVKFLGLPDPPHITGIVKVGKSVTNFLHFVSGVAFDDPKDLENNVKVGMKLRPVWKDNRVGDMFDIAYFEPA
jgi:uncharacterized OB-fold protein